MGKSSNRCCVLAVDRPSKINERAAEGEELVPPIRIERTTYGLGNRCSIQLSYGGVA